MLEERQKALANCRNDLLTALTIAQERRDRGKANEGKRQEYEKAISELDVEIGDLIECGNHLKDIYKNIKHYSIEHQQKVRDILDLAIEEAGELIVDADVAGVHLNQTENNRITVVNNKGQNVNLREGGGYRVVLGALLKYACLRAQPNALQVILFDEFFFTLSDISVAALKPILLAMKNEIIVICVEQRKNVLDGIMDYEFTFSKDANKVTTVKRTM